MTLTTTILLCLYFSINSFIAGYNSSWNRGEGILFQVFSALASVVGALPFYVCDLVWEILKELWIAFCNKTGASFYFKFYVLKQYDDYTMQELEDIEARMELFAKNEKMQKWGRMILERNNYTSKPSNQNNET